MKNLFRFALLVAVILLSACRTLQEHTIHEEMSSQFITESSHGCIGASLDRYPAPQLARQHPPPEGTVVAGFFSRWHPGADPLPCSRFKRAEVRGAFRFDRIRAPAEAKIALLDLVEFQPVAGSVMVGSRPNCVFKLLTRNYLYSVDGRFHHGLDFTAGAEPLASRPRAIRVPNDVGRWTAVVTQEVLGPHDPASRRSPPTFFLVQDDPGFDGHHNSACVGNFRFRLRLLGKDEG